MRLDRLSVALRPRTPWEALDLGQQLARRHARAAWGAWFAASAPFFVFCNLVAWLIGPVWMAGVAMWWLKPLFERFALYVLSRAVFGEVPGIVATLRAAPVWRPGQIVAWLTWRRLHPARALLLPVDLLEAPRGAARGARVRVLQQAVSSPAWGLTLVGAFLELALFASAWALVLMFSPIEFLPERAQAMAQTVFSHPPDWVQLAVNLVLWLASSAIGPVYIGAGFGLYLHRRTELEAWDVELAFRRLADRARALGTALALLALLALPVFAPGGAAAAATPAPAQEKSAAPTAKKDCDCKPRMPVSPRALFGDAWQPRDPGFARSVAQAYADPTLSPKRTIDTWTWRGGKRDQAKPMPMPSFLAGFARLVALLGEYGLWVLAGVVLGFVLWRLPRWLPWVRDLVPLREPESPVSERADAVAVPLPDDIPAAVRAHWQAGRPREALALLYRASVERLADTLGAPLPPGATEAECLRRARRLPDAAGRTRFADVVRGWQAAAYAHRLPDADGLERLLAGWAQGFGGRP